MAATKDFVTTGESTIIGPSILINGKLSGDEDLTVYIGDKIVYYDHAATSLAIGQLTSSGAIYVGDVAGTSARLTFVLRTDGVPGGNDLADQ